MTFQNNYSSGGGGGVADREVPPKIYFTFFFDKMLIRGAIKKMLQIVEKVHNFLDPPPL